MSDLSVLSLISDLSVLSVPCPGYILSVLCVPCVLVILSVLFVPCVLVVLSVLMTMTTKLEVVQKEVGGYLTGCTLPRRLL